MSDNSTMKGYAPFDLYPYDPAQPPAYAFLAMFGIAAVAHLVALFPYRCAFPLPMIIGCGMEAAAYYFRSLSHNDVRRTLPFVIQNLLLLAAPPFLAASVYMSPRRLARALDAEDLVPSPRLLTKLFVLVDAACFATQVAGAIMSGSEDGEQAAQGRAVILTGLVLQVVAFGFFAAWAGAWHARARRAARSEPGSALARLPWRRCAGGLYAVSTLFVVRNITKIVEYKQGSEGQIQSTEAYLYVLDGCVMLAIAVVFLVLHPGRVRMQARRLSKAGFVEGSIPLM